MHQAEYIGPDDFHDGRLLDVTRPEAGLLQVRVQGSKGAYYRVTFRGVRSVSVVEPEGMLLYALTRRPEAAGVFRFIFANWNEDEATSLEVLAAGHMIEREDVAT